MKAINRKQAEELLLNSEVTKSDFNQEKKKICIVLKLTNGKTILMKYSVLDNTKSYYLA